MALTDTEIRRSKPGDKPFKLSYGGGLHLMVTPSGGKVLRLSMIGARMRFAIMNWHGHQENDRLDRNGLLALCTH
jgi:hypothetical protein